jgi:molybdopterin/thiamine biosynthesis adenylyltransferase
LLRHRHAEGRLCLPALSKPKRESMTNDLLTREIAAGYDPERLAQTRVLLVGGGALGQNVGLNLALSQVGQICLVDMDRFEAHNATRSPCFPSPSERRRWGDGKAAVVARKLRQLVSWSERPELTYSEGPIQQFGDEPFRNATVVVSAVDSDVARAYVGSMARKHRLPLVEGGFHGADVSFCVLSNDGDGPCWSCHRQPQAVDHLRMSCTAGARQAEAVGFVPATQPAAGVLAALMAEAAIQLGHDNREFVNHRVYLNARSAKATTVRLAIDELCAGRHDWPETSLKVAVAGSSPASELLGQLAALLAHPSVSLPHRFVVSAPCAGCLNPLEINRPEWALSGRPRCQGCGGPWQLRNGETDGVSPPVEVYPLLSEDTPELFRYSLDTLGIAPGTLLEVTDDSSGARLVDVCGSVPPTLL